MTIVLYARYIVNGDGVDCLQRRQNAVRIRRKMFVSGAGSAGPPRASAPALGAEDDRRATEDRPYSKAVCRRFSQGIAALDTLCSAGG